MLMGIGVKEYKGQKLKTLQRKLKELPNEIRDEVLIRYSRFCMDQNAYTLLSYREIIARSKYSKQETIAFNFRLGMRRGSHFDLVKKEDGKSEVLVLDPEMLGEKVNFLIPCLDPSKKKRSKKENT